MCIRDRDGIDLISNLLVMSMLAVFLLWMDWMITLVVIGLLGFCSVFYFLLMRGRTENYGKQNQIYNSRMIQAVNPVSYTHLMFSW